MPEVVFADIVSRRAYDPGERPQTIEFPVDDDIQRYTISLDRDGWSATGREIIKVRVEVFDGRQWVKAGGFGTHGGVHIHHLGHTVFFSSITVNINPERGRRIRVFFEVIDSCTIKADIDLLVSNGR